MNIIIEGAGVIPILMLVLKLHGNPISLNVNSSFRQRVKFTVSFLVEKVDNLSMIAPDTVIGVRLNHLRRISALFVKL